MLNLEIGHLGSLSQYEDYKALDLICRYFYPPVMLSSLPEGKPPFSYGFLMVFL